MSNVSAIQREPRLARLLQEQANAVITQWEQPGPRMICFRVRCDQNPEGVFLPGQHILLGLPRLHPPVRETGFADPQDIRWTHLVRRAYSITSRPQDLPELEFVIAPVEDGSLTEKLHQAGRGGRVWIDANFRGAFTLEAVPPDSDLLMVATGTGLAPFLSMLRTHTGTGRWRRAALLHGVRTAEDLVFAPELKALGEAKGDLVYVPAVSRDPQWAGRTGRVDALLRDQVDLSRRLGWSPEPDRTQVMLCGHSDMVDDLEAELAGRGWEVGKNLHLERYWKSRPQSEGRKGQP